MKTGTIVASFTCGLLIGVSAFAQESPAEWKPELSSTPEGGLAPGDGTTQDTIALWRFNEGEGDIARDLGPAKADLKLKETSWIDGKFGKAISLDAEKRSMGSLLSRWVKAEPGQPKPFSIALKAITPPADSSWTISAVIRSSAASGVAFEQPCSTYFPGSLALHFEKSKANMTLIKVQGCPYGRATVSAKAHPNDGKWHHIAMACNGEELQLWIDGIQDATLKLPNSPAPEGLDFVIGCSRAFQEKQGAWWTGDIDEIRLEKGAQSDFLRVRKLFAD